jgi:hypothetical protein
MWQRGDGFVTAIWQSDGGGFEVAPVRFSRGNQFGESGFTVTFR